MVNKLKILRVISSVNSKAGGPINGLINSTAGLVNLGHSVDVAALDNPIAPWVGDFDIPLYTFESTLGVYSYSTGLAKWLNNNVANYDIVVIHGLWQFHSFSAAKACKKNSIPFVVFTHGMLDPWFNLNQKLKTIKKKVYWQIFERHVINNADYVLFTSETEERLARIPFSPYSANGKVVAYGCPSPTVEKNFSVKVFIEAFPELSNKKIGLFLSRIHPKKGIDLLIEALGKTKHLPDDFIFAIAGPDSGETKNKLQHKINEFGLESRLVWLGMLEGDIKWGAFHAANFFILPSHQENFGIVVAEALSTSTPVLITNKVNIWREIESSGAGFVENDDVLGVERLLENWFVLSEFEKSEMSLRAKACYDSNFSIESAAQDLEKLLCDVVAKC